MFKRPRETVELSLFEEMRELASTRDAPSPRSIVRMATFNAAVALGLAGKIGELKETAFADLIAVPFKGKVSQAYEAVVGHDGGVVASMIGGKWAVKPQSL